jgi:hypothetical protein
MADTFQPGDIWFHKGMGKLAVTDEDRDLHPGYLKCYWMMGGNPNAPYTFMDPTRTQGFALVSRMEEK